MGGNRKMGYLKTIFDSRIQSIIDEELSERISTALLQHTDGTVMINPRFFKKIVDGYAYSVSHRSEAVGSGSSVDIFFENPSGSGRRVFIIMIEVVSFAQAWIDIYRNNTVSASGTSITPVNLNFENGYASVVNVEYGGTYTTGTLVHSTVCPGGSAIRAVGGTAEVGESVVIPEGFNFLIRATNQSTSDADMSIRMLWWEETST